MPKHTDIHKVTVNDSAPAAIANVTETMPRLDKTAFDVVALHDNSDEKLFWQSKSGTERLQAVEYLRQVAYAYDPTTTRLQRVLEVVERTWR